MCYQKLLLRPSTVMEIMTINRHTEMSQDMVELHPQEEVHIHHLTHLLPPHHHPTPQADLTRVT